MNADHGTQLAGRYRLTEMIGSGGAGTVWAAVDELLGRRVAVKDVGGPHWLTLESWEAVRERTMREARATALIDHPNVVRVYDLVEVNGRPWIVMELVEAQPLSRLVDEHGPLSAHRAAKIGLQLLDALRATHRHGILHRDVKPSNVLIDEHDRAVLTDFGIATIDGDSSLTASGMLVGAPAFIAPERVHTANGSGEVGPAADLWSLGATLYTAVEGRPPYQRDDPISTMAAVVHDEPDPMRLAGALAPVLTALLRRDADERPDADRTEAMLDHVVTVTAGATGATGATDLPPLAEPTVADVQAVTASGVTDGQGVDSQTTRVISSRPPRRPVSGARPRTRMSRAGMARTAALLSSATLVLMFVLAQAAMSPGSGTPQRSPEPVAPASQQSNGGEPAGDDGRDGSGPAPADQIAPAADVSSIEDQAPTTAVGGPAPGAPAPGPTGGPVPTGDPVPTGEPSAPGTTTPPPTTTETVPESTTAGLP